LLDETKPHCIYNKFTVLKRCTIAYSNLPFIWHAVICIAVVMLYFIIGGVFYVSTQSWTVDAIYFTTVISVSGNADFTPTTDGSVIFTILFIVSGISVAAFVLSVIGTYVIARQKQLLAVIFVIFEKFRCEISRT